MLLLPIKIPTLTSGDDLADILHATGMIQTGDIIVISSKAIATVEGAAIDLSLIKPSKEAEKFATICHQDPHFTQAVLDETARMHGDVVSTSPWVLLTSLKPTGMKHGRILCPNAGLDQSNVGQGLAIGWPKDAVKSVRRLRTELENFGKGPRKPKSPKSPTNRQSSSGSSRLAIILSDSCCSPGRLGVVAFALACAGIQPIRSEVGASDLFGKKLHFTNEAVADQLATVGNTVMGNTAQSTPAAIIRDHGLTLTDDCGWVEGIEPEEDLFKEVLRLGKKGKKAKGK